MFSDGVDEGVDDTGRVTLIIDVMVIVSELAGRVTVTNVLAVLAVLTEDDLEEVVVEDGLAELVCVDDFVLEEEVVGDSIGVVDEPGKTVISLVWVTVGVIVMVVPTSGPVEEPGKTVISLVWVTVGVIVTVVSVSELAGVDVVGGSRGRALAKHPTCTPAVVFIGAAEHAESALQGVISKLPALEHWPMSPLIQAT